MVASVTPLVFFQLEEGAAANRGRFFFLAYFTSKNMMLTASVATASTSESTSYRLMHITSLVGENLRASVTYYQYNTDVPLGKGLG